MGIFDKNVDQKDFDSFKTEIQKKLEQLSTEIKLKITDSEEVARTAAANAIEAETRVRATESNVINALAALESYKNQALAELQAIQKEKEKVINSNTTLIASTEESRKAHMQLIESKAKADSAVAEISANFEKIKSILVEAQQLPQSVEGTKKLVLEAQALNDNLQNLLTHSMKRKSEIDELHKNIFGHDVKDSEGKVEHIDGLKDDLEASYEEVANQTESLDERLQNITTEISSKHTELLEKQVEEFEKLVTDSNVRITAVDDQLKALLPGGLAAGLSAAYEGKKAEEEKSLKRFEFGFLLAITGLVLVSLIPFCVDIYLLKWKEMDLLQVIQDTPSLIVAIFPLYFPVLWLAYSTNKKLNLSKRLIEEYTHKAVLGKTFSGLSNQIETLPHESAVKEELRTRLLFNVLQVSAENPGKLITNYNKSDHPLMEALENSAKLSDSIETLSKIPGMSSLVKKLSEKGDSLLLSQEKKVEAGFAAQTALEGEPEVKQS